MNPLTMCRPTIRKISPSVFTLQSHIKHKVIKRHKVLTIYLLFQDVTQVARQRTFENFENVLPEAPRSGGVSETLSQYLYGLGCRVWGLGQRNTQSIPVWFRVQGLGFRLANTQVDTCMVQGLGFGVQGLQGLGFRSGGISVTLSLYFSYQISGLGVRGQGLRFRLSRYFSYQHPRRPCRVI